jgi:2'-5' RNA ligase
MATLRTFVAAPLPEEYQAAMAEIGKRWKPGLKSKMSWTRPGNWHMTLKFLGDTPEERLPEIKAALERVEFEPFAFRAGRGGFFPPLAGRRPNPRVMWVGCEKGWKESAALAAAVEKAVEPLGYKPERRPFSPHLTIARIRRAANDPWDEIMQDLAGTGWPELTIDRFELLKSDLSPQGPTYTPLAVFPGR